MRRMLFITQKINESDDDLAFVILWVKEFIKQGIDVRVICLEKGAFDNSFPAHSLGKEEGLGKLRRAVRFLKLLIALDYDRVFVHMNPEYFTLGGWWWFLRGIPVYFWYTHYTMTMHVRLAGLFSTRMFAATKQSLPQYEGSPKKIVTGHGIDLAFWNHGHGVPMLPSEKSLSYINRLSRSKRVELAIQALGFLPHDYTLTVYGRVVTGEEKYNEELRMLAEDERYRGRVFFKGSLPMSELKNIYPRYRLMINMALETIDKTMLECMLFGVYPITTKSNSVAIGLPAYPENDAPESIARFILEGTWRNYDRAYLERIVREKHSLPALIQKMNVYIVPGV